MQNILTVTFKDNLKDEDEADFLTREMNRRS